MNNRQQRDAVLKVLTDALAEQFRAAGLDSYLVMGLSSPDAAMGANFFFRAHATLISSFNILAAMMMQYKDEELREFWKFLLTHPELQAKLQAAEAKATAASLEKLNEQPAPSVPSPKNKSWLN